VRLDADRLEELAVSCQALNHDCVVQANERCADLDRQAREACGEIAVFARVLDATRANIAVLNQLRKRRRGQLEYDGRFAAGSVVRRMAGEKRWGQSTPLST
jgi:hypothetical protein